MLVSPVPEAWLHLATQNLSLESPSANLDNYYPDGMSGARPGASGYFPLGSLPIKPLLGTLKPVVALPLSAAETGVPAFVPTLFLSPACPLAACLCRFPSLPVGWAWKHARCGCLIPSFPPRLEIHQAAAPYHCPAWAQPGLVWRCPPESLLACT